MTVTRVTRPEENPTVEVASEYSTLFRGQHSVDPTEVTGLRLIVTDIGGHSIRFLDRSVGNSVSRSVVIDVTCVSVGRSCAEVSFSR